MGFMLKHKSGWCFDFVLDIRQWVVGFNFYRRPWPMWNVFVGPLRIGGHRQFASHPITA